MTERLLVDLAVDGRVTVSALGDAAGGLPEPGESFTLDWSLDAAEIEDLRWYLEDYLRAPYGVYEQRGEQVTQRLTGWGRAGFAALFERGSRQARDMYVRLRDRGGVAEIVVRSSVAELLGLPWELLADPARPAPLALDGVRIRRALPTGDLAGTFPVAGERLRVLMVISRPAGTGDVGYRMVARPLLQRLDAVRGEVDLVVLRPPTLQRLGEVLHAAREQGQPFQVVHFDGHGAFADRRPSPGWGVPVTLDGPAPQGVLVFEQPRGGPDEVPAERVAAVLAEAQVPLVVLNACQSGALGRQVEAAVATRLLQQGTAAVVAMAFSVYAVAAAEFMAAFYERLFAGGQVADAVAAGRRRMAERNTRPSPRGPLPLQDWLVPVHYGRQDVSFPWLHTRRDRDGVSLEQILDAVRQHQDVGGEQGDPLAAVGGFVGRDGLFYELETAARLQKVVLLHGPAGTGKTEVAKAFGRWWRDTGGVDDPEWVIWHSFEPGVASFGLPGVLSTVGLRLFGPDFARLDDGQRLPVVRQVLRQHRLLLIWDNLESAYTMPEPGGATPPLDEIQRRELVEFLTDVAGGASAVLITSRSGEEWLGGIRRIRVGGLSKEEADEYTDALLAPYPRAAKRRREPAFADLLTWLGGHPLSMRLVLPHLDTTGPAAVLAGLRDLGGELLGDDAHGRTASLGASIAYSYRHLTVDEQQALAAVCLFHAVADADVLGAFSASDQVPLRFRDRDAQGWAALLDRATEVGLLSAIGAGMYTIHPALPAYLATQWRHQQPDTYPGERAAAQQALLHACAVLAAWLHQQITGGDAEMAFSIVHLQRQTLGAMLGYAIDTGQHQSAAAIARALTHYWDTVGLYEEARGWTDRIRQAVESPDGIPPALDSAPGALWLFVVGAEAGREINAQQLDAAEHTYRQIADALATQPDTPTRDSHLATAYHQLGRVAEERGELDTAEQWYQRSLTIEEQLGNQPGMASSYHQLGMVAQDRGELDTAEQWYQRSLTIEEQLGNQPGMATSYHQLGMVAQLQGELDTAEQWYQRSLTIKEQLGNRPGMARGYHQLGLLAEQRGTPAVALEWTIRCVMLFDSFPHPATGPAPRHLARLTQQLGWDALRRSWRQVTGQDPPPAVVDTLKAILNQGTDP